MSLTLVWDQVRRSRMAMMDPSGRMETGPHPFAVRLTGH